LGKKGTAFERAVADIVESFGNVTDLKQGSWVEGPDGRRDRDVSFCATAGPRIFKVLIECKDYNPKSMGKIGIELVDALESKRRDLGVDVAMICSNAGFSEPALRKALRVGISTIGAVRMGDERVRFSINDAIYFRKVTVPIADVRVSFEGYAGQPPWGGRETDTGLVTLGGLRLVDWVAQRIFLGVGANQIVSGRYRLTFRMLRPLMLSAPSGDAAISHIAIAHSLTGCWYRQPATISGTSGIYDWQRKRVRLAPGEVRQVSKTINFDRGLAVSQPPGYVLAPLALLPDEVDFYALMLHGPNVTGQVPGIDAYVDPADLSPIITEALPAECYTSTRKYVHPRDAARVGG
jgi:hypothetical protein